ncbi:DUF6879 family protein [Streptomyces sp. NBC_01207]|uniref:DUF6879 family protein n=1 Tax=Streptomyces sp. NBC_01207 TaxID=2903772 RepID=UPI002E107A28|nr:DUF6879 family protein [Streptomyces sp. NBC_01207]
MATGRRNTDSDSEYWAFWTGLVRRTTARGVSVRRVRIVSDYSCYSHAGAVVNIAAGEENLVERTRAFRVYCSHVVPGLLHPRIRGRRHRQVRHLPPGGRRRRGRRGGPGDPAIG